MRNRHETDRADYTGDRSLIGIFFSMVDYAGLIIKTAGLNEILRSISFIMLLRLIINHLVSFA